MDKSKTIKTANGADLVVRHADFQDAMRLQRLLMAQLSNADMNMDIGDMKGMESLEQLLPVLFDIGANEDIHKAMFVCLSQCTYNGQKITESLFDDVDVRADYYEIMLECGKLNLACFFKNLFSRLKENKKTQTENQK